MKKILVIEDDRIMRENITELLELVGYSVETAKDGREGVKKAQTILPDLIICDIKMPELDGYGVLYILESNPKTAGIPFIFVTAKTEKTDRRKGMEMGADDYLSKPFEDTELLNAIEARLKKSEILSREFSHNAQGFNDFFKEVNNLYKIKNLQKKPQLKEYKTKELIFRSEDFPHYLYFIEKGRIKTYKLNNDGKEFITNIYQAGDFFGYKPIFEDRMYNENAEPLEPCIVQLIPKDLFLTLINENRDVSNKLIKIISKNLSEKEEELIRLAYDSVRKRLAFKLLEIIKQGKNESVSILRSDIASLIGTTTETLVRILSELKNLKIIETDGQTITMLDREKLIEFAKTW